VFFKKQLFNAEQKQQIVASIQEAEKVTSGEIKVHLEPKCAKDPMTRALEVFHKLGVHKTEHKNGVLIYIAWQDKKFAIVGDSGINAVVPANFWDGTKEVMKGHFSKGEFLEGIRFAIKETGVHLAQYFPHHDDDKNELSDEISEG
jgi:uncharacterized membrane protein